MQVVILLHVAATAFACLQCGENEHFESCGTACPLTCSNYDNPPRYCPQRCEIGCHCNYGYVKDSSGRCVRPEDCPSKVPKCGVNEYYDTCSTDYPLTCSNFDNPPHIYTNRCNTGCHCNKGYVRNSDGRCIRPEDCSKTPQCGYNEHFELCGTACPLTCENYDNPPQFCGKKCDIGCQCNAGYIRNSDGSCIRPEECPEKNPKCKENEHLEFYGTSCPLTCNNYDNPPPFCIMRCNVVCQCNDGYVKNREGRCIKSRNDECPDKDQQCYVNEYFDSCGTACPLTCNNYDNPPQSCVKRCFMGCQCNDGYVRNSEGLCITPEECPAKANLCGENEHFLRCGTACQLTCDNYNNPPTSCIKSCYIGCQCKVGYVRNSEGLCVSPELCPVKTHQICRRNEVYLECGTACPLTCDNYKNPPQICPTMCVSGCHCKTGYVRTRDGNCMKPEYCSTEQICFGEPNEGEIVDYIPSWYYYDKTGECYEFIYGGYKGNGNRYTSKEECMEYCGNARTKQSISDVCNLPAELGYCPFTWSYRINMTETCLLHGSTRFYFDNITGRCQRFIYGGCGGNENNFKTIQDCMNVCALSAIQVCQQEKVIGPCSASIKRFYFNKKTKQCEEFTFGGCLANSNNFYSKKDCEDLCIGK